MILGFAPRATESPINELLARVLGADPRTCGKKVEWQEQNLGKISYALCNPWKLHYTNPKVGKIFNIPSFCPNPRRRVQYNFQA